MGKSLLHLIPQELIFKLPNFSAQIRKKICLILTNLVDRIRHTEVKW